MSSQPLFRPTRAGIEFLPGRFSLPRHRHLRPYVTVVLSGSFDEIGYLGRVRATAGDVLVHPPMDCHANEMISAGVQLLRLEWAADAGGAGYYRLDQVEQLAGVAERDPVEASALLKVLLEQGTRPAPQIANDWPDELATALGQDRRVLLGQWARARGMAPETISRGFKAAYGVTPVEFRAERRAREAWLLATRSRERLATIATATGFADQAHMTRWVHRVTGAPPAAWRRTWQQ